MDAKLFFGCFQLGCAVVQLACWVVVLISLKRTNKSLDSACKFLSSMKKPR